MVRTTRRTFTKGLAGSSIAAGVGLASRATPATARSRKFDEQVEVTFWKPPHSDHEQELWAPILEDFSTRNPGVKVSHSIIDWSDVETQFTAAFAGGEPPDVFYLPDEFYIVYANEGLIADIAPTLGDLETLYNPVVWANGAYKGTLYGVPFMGGVQTFILNLDLFEQAGLAIPTTWAELHTAAQAIAALGDDVYGIDFLNQFNMLNTVLGAGGVRLMSDDLTAIAANTEAGIAAWKALLEDIGRDEQSRPMPPSTSYDLRSDLVLRGKVGIIWTESSTIKPVFRRRAPDMNITAIPVPAVEGTDGKATAWGNWGYMFMAAESAHPDAALAFLRYLASREVQERYVIQGVDLISPMTGVVAPDVDPVVAQFVEMMAVSTAPTLSTRWRTVADTAVQEADGVLSGQKSVAEALEDIEAIVEPLLNGT